MGMVNISICFTLPVSCSTVDVYCRYVDVIAVVHNSAICVYILESILKSIIWFGRQTGRVGLEQKITIYTGWGKVYGRQDGVGNDLLCSCPVSLSSLCTSLGASESRIRIYVGTQLLFTLLKPCPRFIFCFFFLFFLPIGTGRCQCKNCV